MNFYLDEVIHSGYMYWKHILLWMKLVSLPCYLPITI